MYFIPFFTLSSIYAADKSNTWNDEVCDMKIDKEDRYKYMDQAYPGKGIIGRASEKLFDVWDKQYPVDKWECERANRIEGIQGNENPIVKEQ